MPIRVLTCDDSPFVGRWLASQLHADDELRPIGHALTGERAVELAELLRPDVITLDLAMPGIGGLEALARIMAVRPTPVVLMTGLSRSATRAAVEGLALGAIDFVPKYTPGRDTDPAELREQLIAKVKLAASVKVIRSPGVPTRNLTPPPPSLGRKGECRSPSPLGVGVGEGLLPRTPPPAEGPPPAGGILVIGASTGGPIAVRDLLFNLPPDYPAAVVVVQHMPPAFTGAFAEQLARQTPHTVREAVDGERLVAGVVLVVPGDKHLVVRPGRIALEAGAKADGYRPSVDATMASAARVYGRRATGVLLTGMGDDGAAGLLAIRDAGGATFAQDEASCTAFGMPARAAELGAAETIDSPAGIASHLAGRLAPPKGVASW